MWSRKKVKAVIPPAQSVLDAVAPDVMHRYAAAGRLAALGNQGGFSGARLWHLETTAGAFCLRAWPPQDPLPERLDWMHGLMRRARAAGLTFVPRVWTTTDGVSWMEAAGSLWDLTDWMPGRADFLQRPEPARLEAACTALATLHGAWAAVSPRVGRCPAIVRRLECMREWNALVASGWQPIWSQFPDAPLRPWAERAWTLLQTWADWVPRVLAPWAEYTLPLQPCLCDVWHDHVLFDGNKVTGMIDYGSVKLDHVAVDLARLLGSFVGDDREQRRIGLRAYSRVRPLNWQEQSLVDVLDETGTLIGLVNWLRWLGRDGRIFNDPDAVAKRFAALVGRVDCWPRPNASGRVDPGRVLENWEAVSV
jgi:homoserine kinase type II